MNEDRPRPPWREFERLVAMIEESAGPRGAVVTSPDRLRDLTTNKMREVDASIRCTAGSVDILITIECQKRRRKADDTWIEQLATKRQKIGAAKTIAVSAKGFTRAAHLTARQHGIELRTLSEIRPQDVAMCLARRHGELSNHNTPAPPILLTIAGFDPSGGAGIAADLKTFAAHNCYGVAAVTALTVQSTQGVVSTHLTPAADR